MKILQRTFIPGDNWVYLKIYTGIKIADWIMTDILFHVIKKMIKEKFVDEFFFIRYNDPDFHLRLRFLLSNNSYFSDVIDILNRTLKPIIEKQLVWKMQLDTYQREIERYSPYLIEDTELFFYIDSMSIIKIINQLNKFKDEKYRWMISLLLNDKLLSTFDFSIEQKKDLMTQCSDYFKEKYGFNQFNSKQFNEKYRENKIIVKYILEGIIIDENYNRIVKLVNQRSHKLKPVIININRIVKKKKLNMQDYIGSYIHMSMNRLFRADNGLYELIVYDFMKRYYTSQVAIKNQLK